MAVQSGIEGDTISVMQLTRRGFIGAAAAAALPLQAAKLKAIGAQLYTLRAVLPKQPLETLKALEALGYNEIEAVGGGLDAIWGSIQQTKLKPISVHLDTALFGPKIDALPAALDDMKSKGFQYVVCPYVPPGEQRSVENMKRLGENLNKAGEKARAAGMTLCYHNHAFEFAPQGNSTILDDLMKDTDAKLVQLELDIMWVKVAGLEPANLLAKYKGRVPLMHVKNVAAIDQRYDERVPREAFKEVGAGVIDVAKTLKAGTAAGVKHFFVEQDQTPGDPLDSLKQSIEYLKGLNF